MMMHHSGIWALERVHLVIDQEACERLRQHPCSGVKAPVTVSLGRLQQEERECEIMNTYLWHEETLGKVHLAVAPHQEHRKTSYLLGLEAMMEGIALASLRHPSACQKCITNQ